MILGSAASDDLSLSADTDSFAARTSGYGGGCGCGCGGGSSHILPFLLGALALSVWFLNMQVITFPEEVKLLVGLPGWLRVWGAGLCYQAGVAKIASDTQFLIA